MSEAGRVSEPKAMRGYFGIGVEGISKPMNLGAILRTAHAFRASFAFAIQHPERVTSFVSLLMPALLVSRAAPRRKPVDLFAEFRISPLVRTRK